MTERYEVFETDNEYYAYDKQQDIFVDRFRNPVQCGYLTQQEAIAVVKRLNSTL